MVRGSLEWATLLSLVVMTLWLSVALCVRVDL